MNKQRVIIGVLLFLVSAASIQAQSLHMSLRLFNETVYFPSSRIHVYVTVRNESASSVAFRLADNRMFNLRFDARDVANRTVPGAREFTIGRMANQVYYRTVVLQPGEEISFTEELTRYVTFEQTGTYTVTGRFFPELEQSAAAPSVTSNPISVTIRPGHTPAIAQEARFEAILEQQPIRRQMSPDDVVSHMIDARRASNWEQFFLYLNIEKLYRQSDERDRRFRRLSEQERLEELVGFRDLLRSDGRENLLVQIPSDFEILETTYTPTQGSVAARLYFDFPTYQEIRLYTYQVERRNGFWEIIGYTVVNLGTRERPRS